MSERDANGRPRVVIVGGGIAGLEAALALHHLAPDAAQLTLVAPEPEFHYKPMVVLEPFSRQPARRHELAPALEQLGGRFVKAALVGVHPDEHAIELAGGERLGYEMLIVAVGGRARPAYEGADTFWAARGDLPIDEVLERAAGHPSRTLAFVVPPGCSWPLPLYELALMTRRRCEEGGPYGVSLLLVSPEQSPLAVFGVAPSQELAELLRARAIDFEPFRSVVERGGKLLRLPGGKPLEAGAVVALPTIEGPGVHGLPADDHGFVPIDEQARVIGVEDVYAAGDGTDFPVKQGGIATQQADAAAEHIASRLGAAVHPTRFRPVLRGQLITGADSLHMKHELAGGRGAGAASLDCLWWPPGKVAGRFLAPWLAGTTPAESLEPPSRPLDVEVALPLDWHGSPMAMGGHPNPVDA